MLLLLDRLSTKSACRQQNTMPSKDESRIALRALCIRSTSTFWAKTLDPPWNTTAVSSSTYTLDLLDLLDLDSAGPAVAAAAPVAGAAFTVGPLS